MTEQVQKYLAEVIGTFIWVGVGTGAILAASSTETPAQAAIPLAFGLALLIGLYAVGETSGGHFNPAVTLAAFVDRRISLSDLIGYWISQMAGGILGSFTLAVLTNRLLVASTSSAPGGNLGRTNVGPGEAFLGEVLFTAIFVMVFLAATKSGALRKAFIPMSLALAGVHFVGFPLTGASVNPARSFGPFVVGDFVAGLGIDRADIWIYLTAPLVGALLGWIVYKVVVTGDTSFGDDFREIKDAVTE